MFEVLAWLVAIEFLIITALGVCFYILYLKLRDGMDSFWSEIIDIKWKYLTVKQYVSNNIHTVKDIHEHHLEPLKEDIKKQKYLLENLESRINTNDILNHARSNNRESVIVDAIDAIANYMNIEFVKKEDEKPIARKKQSNKTKNKNAKHIINNRRVKK